MENGILLPLFYLGPIEYFSKIKSNSSQVYLEKFEHYPKQTFRNRASIQSPNGKLDLTIPIKKGAHVHTKMKDVRISYDADWQRLHWRSLQTSYRSSSYFEYYEDDFAPFFHSKIEFLFDFNLSLLELCLSLLKIDPTLQHTETYMKSPEGVKDYRDVISPKKLNTFVAKPYFQVFEDQHGFLPNLSIVDLLFSQGPQSKQYL